MLKIRVLGAAIVVLIIALSMMIGNLATAGLVFVLTLAGLYEFYHAIGTAGHRPISYLGYIYSVPVFISAVMKSIDKTGWIFDYKYVHEWVLYFFIMSVFTIMILSKGKYNILDAALTITGYIYVTFLLEFIFLIRSMDGGTYLVWLLFMGVWGADTGAYFTGRYLGRRKIVPSISPNKTVEGSIGGIAGAVLLTWIYGMLFGKYMSGLSTGDFILLGILSGIVSQLGDWMASSVKRFAGIKDYANIVPGHGGVLDRFDSIMSTAPLVYFYLNMVL